LKSSSQETPQYPLSLRIALLAAVIVSVTLLSVVVIRQEVLAGPAFKGVQT
jgi:hypothetical protein